MSPSSSSTTQTNNNNINNTNTNCTAILIKKVFPYLALFCIPLFSSMNATVSRAAFTFVPEGKEPLKPFVLACVRLHIAFLCFLAARWFRNNYLLQRPDYEPHTLDEAVVDVENSSKQKNNKQKQKNWFIRLISSLSQNDQQLQKDGSLQSPEHFTPALVDIMQAWLLGVFTCGNVFFFVIGIQWTDGITTGASMTFIPPCVYIIGYLAGLEVYSHVRTLATLLIIAGNVLMNHLWKLFLNSDNDYNNINHNNNSSTTPIPSINQTDNHEHNIVINQRGTVPYFIGVGFLMISVLSSSLYLVFQRPLSKRMSFMDFLVHMYGACSVIAFVASLFPRDNLITDQLFVTGLYPTAILAIFIGSVLQSFLGFFFLSFATNYLQSTVIVVLFRAAGPVFIVIESVLFLNETLDQYQVYGGIVVLCGVGLSLSPVLCGDSNLKNSETTKNGTDENSNNEKGNPTTEDGQQQQIELENKVVMSPTVVVK